MPKQVWPLDVCKEAVARRWGKEARYLFGEVLYEALLNEALLLHLNAQDESIDPATIVRVLTDGRSQIIDEINKEA
jgi:hypothetical protein